MATFAKQTSSLTIYDQIRFARLVADYFHILPPDAVPQPGSEGFKERFLGGKTHRKMGRRIFFTQAETPLIHGKQPFKHSSLTCLQKRAKPLDTHQVAAQAAHKWHVRLRLPDPSSPAQPAPYRPARLVR